MEEMLPHSDAASRSRRGSSARVTRSTRATAFDGLLTRCCSTIFGATAQATAAATQSAASTGRRPGSAARRTRLRRRPILTRQLSSRRSSERAACAAENGRERVPLPGDGVRPGDGRARLVGCALLRPRGELRQRLIRALVRRLHENRRRGDPAAARILVVPGQVDGAARAERHEARPQGRRHRPYPVGRRKSRRHSTRRSGPVGSGSTGRCSRTAAARGRSNDGSSGSSTRGRGG